MKPRESYFKSINDKLSRINNGIQKKEINSIEFENISNEFGLIAREYAKMNSRKTILTVEL